MNFQCTIIGLLGLVQVLLTSLDAFWSIDALMPPQAPTAQLLQLLQLHLNYARTHLTSSEPQFFCVGKGQVVCYGLLVCHFTALHGSLNVPIEHHPTIRYMVYNGYYKVMSNIPKMGQLPTHVMGFRTDVPIFSGFPRYFDPLFFGVCYRFMQDMILKQDGSMKDQLGGKFSIFNGACGSNYNPKILPCGKPT